LRHYLGVVWRRKFVLLAIVLLIPAAVYAISKQVPKEYESSTTLQIEATAVSSSVFSNAVTVNASTAEDAARLIQTTLVAELAAEELGEDRDGARGLLSQISVELDTSTSASTSTDFLTITARDEDPQRAADIANAFGDAVAQRRTRDAVQSIEKTIELLTEESATLPADDVAAREALAQQLQDLRGLRATQQNTTVVVEPAVPATSPVSPRPLRNTALAFVLSLLLAAALVPLLDRLDRRIRTARDVEDLIGEPLLAMVPASAFPGQAPSPLVREAFQTLRTALMYFNVDRSIATVMITSGTHGEGKTTVATNLAIALAMDDRKVVLIDGDFRKPQVARRMGVEPRAGIESVLLGEASLDDALVPVEFDGISEYGGLYVLPCNAPPPNPSVLLGSGQMKSLLAELSEQADIVLIDTPPVLSVSDAIPLLETVSGTVLVVRLDYSTTDSVRKARQVISSARGQVLGTVATSARAAGLYEYGGYGTGYTAENPLPHPVPPTPGGQNGSNGRSKRLGILRRGRS
jgi:receptor protein-tyrosine kinase/non-specific protein-tyrosine kinase